MPEQVLPPPHLSRRKFVAGTAAAGLSLLGCAHPAAANALSRNLAPSIDISGIASLREHAANAKLLFGFAVDEKQLTNNEAYRRTVQQQCSIIVPEKAMQWATLRPAPAEFNFDEADRLITFSETSHIKLRGNALCSHNALPAWFDRVANPTNARQMLADHIRTVMGRYAGRMHSWDVVNEAVEIRDGRVDGLRNSPWLRLVGTDYVEAAFRVARNADPNALLTYNESGLEDDSREAAEKRAAVLVLLRRLKQRNVPIDAVGIQSHLRARSPFGYGAGLRQFTDACRTMDFEVFLSEMDVSDRDLPENAETRDTAVADEYRKYLLTALAAPNVTTVIGWGVDDFQSSLNFGEHARRDHQPQRSLLFDSHLRPKPAFAAVRDVFDARFGRNHASQAATGQRLPRL